MGRNRYNDRRHVLYLHVDIFKGEHPTLETPLHQGPQDDCCWPKHSDIQNNIGQSLCLLNSCKDAWSLGPLPSAHPTPGPNPYSRITLLFLSLARVPMRTTYSSYIPGTWDQLFLIGLVKEGLIVLLLGGIGQFCPCWHQTSDSHIIYCLQSARRGV